jgi:hypothetical protein
MEFHPRWAVIATFLTFMLLLSGIAAWSDRNWARNGVASILVLMGLFSLFSFVGVGRSLRHMRQAVDSSEPYVEGVQDFLKATAPTQATLLVTTLGLAILAFRRPPSK